MTILSIVTTDIVTVAQTIDKIGVAKIYYI